MIHVFSTKPSSDEFLQNFVETKEHKFYKFEGKGGEKFYDRQWPDFKTIPQGDEVAFQGIIRNTHEIKNYCVDNKIKYYYFDQPYFYMSGYATHDHFNDVFYRVCVNNTQKTFISQAQKYEDRYKEFYKKSPEEITLHDWREKGEHILVIPPSHHTARWYGIDRHKWEKDIVSELKKYTDREIRVRHKFVNNKDWGEKVSMPLKEDLKNCWAMVSWHSMCAVEAVMNGVPSFTSPHSPASPVSLQLFNLDSIEEPDMPERKQWLYSLTGAIFTKKEMKSGYAYDFLQDEE